MPWLRNHAVLNDPDGLSESVPVEFAPVESEVAKAALAISDSTGANSMGAGADGENPSGHPVDRPPRSANRPPQSTFVGDRLPVRLARVLCRLGFGLDFDLGSST